MTDTTLIWTALPAGMRRGNGGEWVATVSVFLTPRLKASAGVAQLEEFPVFVDWPKTLGQLRFDVQSRDGATILLEQSVDWRTGIDPQNAPDSDAWQRVFFSRPTVVRPFETPEELLASSPPALRSYPARHVVRSLRQIYADAVAHHVLENAGPPVLTSFSMRPGRVTATSPGHALDALQQFVDFHRSSGEARPRLQAAASDETHDFHQIVSALGSHPRLLRRLGLVLDLHLPAADLGLDVAGRDLRIRVHPVGPGLDVARHLSYWTAVEYDSASSAGYRVFTPAYEDQVARAGFHRLGDDETSIVQEKLEHATFSLIQHAEVTDSEPCLLPALLQGGMRVTHADADENLRTAMQHQAQLERRLGRRTQSLRAGAAEPDREDEPLTAEKLTRGYRIDVRDTDGGAWRSLCGRASRYQSGLDWSWPSGGRTLEEEGVIEPVTYVDDSSDHVELKTTQDLFEWDGWSLVVPSPDGAADGEPAADDGELPLTAHFKVPPGSLQPQRFGRCYQFRARTVDLAGNSLSVEDANAIAPTHRDSASRPVCCLRVESAKPPVLFPAQQRGPGEASDVIVLRDAEASQYRTKQVRYHVLPPEVPLSLAEKHGMFDAMSDAESWHLIREHRGELGGEAGGDPRDHISAREIYAPYLPDPMVTRAVLKLPDDAGSVDMPAFDDLPRSAKGRELARSCSLVVRGSEQEVKAHQRGRSVTLQVPKGRVQRIEIVAKLSAGDLSTAALAHSEWHVYADHPIGLTAASARHENLTAKLAGAAARGDVPPLAPARVVDIVHATQRPLTAPRFGRPLILPRNPDSTTVVMADDSLEFDAPSTGRVDLYARWEDPVDDPDDTAWRIEHNEIHAAGVRTNENNSPLDPASVAEDQRSPLSHDFQDTKHHEVSYRVEATSRFVNFFPRSLTDDADNVTRISEPMTLHVPGTAPPAAPDIAYVVPTFKREDSALGDRGATREHTTEQIGEGLRVYMNRGWFSSGRGEQLALVVATSQPPEAPRETVTAWGSNPLRDSAPLPGPLKMEHVWGGAKRLTGVEVEGGSVGLIIHDVHFSDVHGLPFADIEFLSQRSFMPLVRLALARYQEHAIEACNLSRIVLADFVPLAPGRALTVTKTGRATWNLSAQGYSYSKSRDVTSVMRAHVEIMAREAPEDPAAWRPLPAAATTLTAVATEAWRYRWTGQLCIDEPQYLSRRWRRRIVVQEFEPFGPAAAVDLEEVARVVSAHTVPI